MELKKRNRRDFLTSSTAAMVATGVAPAIHGATDKAAARVKVVGPEGHRYEVHHDHLTPPEGIPWQDTHGVAIDAEGLIYVKHRTKTAREVDAVVVFDAEGRVVRSFGKEYHGGGHGIDVRREGSEEFLYLCDNKGYIAKTSLKGETVWKQTAPRLDVYEGARPFRSRRVGDYGKGHKFSPTNIAFAPDGGFYVADGYGSHYVIQYDAQGSVQGYFGGAGSDSGKFQTPHGIWWDNRPGRTPALVVCDRANARLQYFSDGGAYLGVVDDVLFPADIDTRGSVMVVPDLHARITLFDKANRVISHLGDDPQWRQKVLADDLALRRQPQRWENGRFIHPHDACFDRAGNLYVAEWVATGRINFLRQVS